jgi:hypothetical protein
MRLALFQVADAEYWWVWTFPHLLLDGWSFPIILRELFGAYDALRERRTMELAPPRPFRDYIEWLEKRDASGDEAFWRGALPRSPPRSSLDAIERGSGTPGRGEQELRLAASVTLVDVAREGQITMNTVVQGAWAVLLSRYGGVDDVLFGATRAGRRATLAGAEEMVGVTSRATTAAATTRSTGSCSTARGSPTSTASPRCGHRSDTSTPSGASTRTRR